MSTLGGIPVAEVTITFFDGRQRTWSNVEWLREAHGVTLGLGNGHLAYIPLHAVRLLEWQVVATGE